MLITSVNSTIYTEYIQVGKVDWYIKIHLIKLHFRVLSVILEIFYFNVKKKLATFISLTYNQLIIKPLKKKVITYRFTLKKAKTYRFRASPFPSNKASSTCNFFQKLSYEE